jgi:hypothetical protein
MTEAEWRAADHPLKMLEFVRGKATGRKLRLFQAACCRRIWELLAEVDRRAVLVAEGFADGTATDRERQAVWKALLRRTSIEPSVAAGARSAAYFAVQTTAGKEREAENAARSAAHAASAKRHIGGQKRLKAAAVFEERQAQPELLRCVVGSLPFRSPAVPDSAVLTWNDAITVRLARDAYDSRTLPSGELDPARLAVLADALEDAGCSDGDLLGHLRSPGPHVRGCWALDLVLGRE